MAELLNWYIEELRQLLAAMVPAEKLDTILREAESHLLESARNRISGISDERIAMEDAINAYGLPKKVAMTYLRRMRRRVLGMPPIYASLLGCLIAIFCWNFHWLTLNSYFDNFSETWQNELAGIVGVAALGMIVAACRVGFRTQWLTIGLSTVATACLSIPLVSFWMVGGTRDRQGISRFHLSRDSVAVRNLVGQIETYQAFLDRGISAYEKAENTTKFKTSTAEFVFYRPADGFSMDQLASLQSKLLPDDLRNAKLAARELGAARFDPAYFSTTFDNGGQHSDKGGQYVVPREDRAFAMIHGGMTVFETVASFDTAKLAWAKTGPLIKEDLEREHTDMLGLLRSADQAKAGRLFFFNTDLYSETFIGTLMLLPLFLLIDGFAAASAKPRRAWPKRRLA